MHVEFSEVGERLTARPRGCMEAAEGTRLAAAVQERLHGGIKSVTIDLEDLEGVGLGGVRALLRIGRSLKSGDRILDFSRGGHAVREALHQAGLNNFFPFEPPYDSRRGIPR